MVIFGATVFGQDYVNENIKKAKEIFSGEVAESAYTDNLSHVDMNTLPIFLKKTFGNTRITLAVSSVEDHSGYETVGIFAKIETGKDTIFFGATGIKFSFASDENALLETYKKLGIDNYRLRRN
jgi:hypothetical protein